MGWSVSRHARNKGSRAGTVMIADVCTTTSALVLYRVSTRQTLPAIATRIPIVPWVASALSLDRPNLDSPISASTHVAVAIEQDGAAPAPSARVYGKCGAT